MKRLLLCLAALVLVVLVAGCAAGPNSVAGTPNSSGQVAGFWLGLWHGIIAPITFIISLFSSNISFYEVHNNGVWYNFGFLLGASGALGGGGRGVSVCKRRGSEKIE